MEKQKVARLLTIILTVAEIILVIAFIIKKDYIYIVEIVIVYTSYLLFLYFEKKKGFFVENYVRGLLIITLIANNFFGEFIDLYNRFQYPDKIMHFFGTFSFSLFAYSVVRKSIEPMCKSRLLNFILITSLGTFLGTMYEIMEFLVDIVIKTVNQPTLVDTNLDMILDVLGAAAAGVFILYKNSFKGKNVLRHV
ncbi:MAG: hypothetical protein N3B21_08375 [Clostridia bacterium]|nr:hypothetical protein [Clostridia bacterium]